MTIREVEELYLQGLRMSLDAFQLCCAVYYLLGGIRSDMPVSEKGKLSGNCSNS